MASGPCSMARNHPKRDLALGTFGTPWPGPRWSIGRNACCTAAHGATICFLQLEPKNKPQQTRLSNIFQMGQLWSVLITSKLWFLVERWVEWCRLDSVCLWSIIMFPSGDLHYDEKYWYIWVFLKREIPKSPWVSILNWSNDLDGVGVAPSWETSISF